MIREWLLVIWLGTTTNFTLHSIHWSQADCNRARAELMQALDQKFTAACVQDMREGRSGFPRRPGSGGIAK